MFSYKRYEYKALLVNTLTEEVPRKPRPMNQTVPNNVVDQRFPIEIKEELNTGNNIS